MASLQPGQETWNAEKAVQEVGLPKGLGLAHAAGPFMTEGFRSQNHLLSQNRSLKLQGNIAGSKAIRR